MSTRSMALSAALAIASFSAPAFAQEDLPEGAESTEAWYLFSEEFATQLQSVGRVREAVEEILACGTLHTDEVDKLADGAVLLVEFGAQQPGGLRPGSEYQRIADDMIRAAVSRGGIGDGRLAYAIGRISFAAVDWGAAYRMFRNARKSGWEPARVEPWYYRAVVNRAPLLLDAMRIDTAVEQLEEVIAAQPDHPETMAAEINLAAAYRRRDERVTAEKILRKLVEKFPARPQPWNTLGQILFDQGRLEEALEAFQNSISRAVALGLAYDEALVSTAHVLYKLGRAEESERVTQSYLRLHQDAPGGLYLMAMLHRDKGETLEAVKVLRRAHRIAPDDTGILTLLQQVHYERDEIDDAADVGLAIEKIEEAARRALDEVDTASKPGADSPGEEAQGSAPPESGETPAPAGDAESSDAAE